MCLKLFLDEQLLGILGICGIALQLEMLYRGQFEWMYGNSMLFLFVF